MRVGRGLYALTAWKDMASVDVPARRINPLDEDILVIARETFDQLTAGHQTGQLYDIHYRSILAKARPIHRMMTQEDHQLVQLIHSSLCSHDARVCPFRYVRYPIGHDYVGRRPILGKS